MVPKKNYRLIYFKYITFIIPIAIYKIRLLRKNRKISRFKKIFSLNL